MSSQSSALRSALVAYGTETGTSYDYAVEVGRMLERIRFETYVDKLDAIDPASTLHQPHNVVADDR